MCVLRINAVADAVLSGLPQSEREACEKKYATMAEADSVETANGLSLLMRSVSDWSQIEELKSVRKIKSGRHRLYFVGRHTDCQYTIVFMLANKRDEDDTPGKPSFQEGVLKALRAPAQRIIPKPDADD